MFSTGFRSRLKKTQQPRPRVQHFVCNPLPELPNTVTMLLSRDAQRIPFVKAGLQLKQSRQSTPFRQLVVAAAAAGAAAAPGGATADKKHHGVPADRNALTPIKEHGDVPVVVTKRGKARLFRDGNPMIYQGAIECVRGPKPALGDPVLVANGAGEPYAWGVYNPHSMFGVRVMQLEHEVAAEEAKEGGSNGKGGNGNGKGQGYGGRQVEKKGAASSPLQLEPLLRRRIAEAVALRAALGLPCADTDAYRLINSEGDRLSGLVVDVFSGTAVAASSAAWVEQQRSAITRLLQEVAGVGDVVWRPSVDMLRAEGMGDDAIAAAVGRSSNNNSNSDGGGESGSSENGASAASASAEEHAEGGSSGGSSGSSGSSGSRVEKKVVIRERGVQYEVDLLHSQKTGFYCDQRDSRAYLASLIASSPNPGALSVLDLCCYSGGFALSAAAAGAGSVLGVDSSEGALALARRNAELNGVADRCAFERGDVAKFMAAAAAEGRTLDIVVLDPPKLAPTRGALQRAERKYRRLNELGMRVTTPGGLLMTCSCSGAMSQAPGKFLGVVQQAALGEGRRVTLLREAGAAADHALDPAYPESKYLTNLLLRVL